MAKKLSDIREKVDSSGLLFLQYLSECLDKEIFGTIVSMSTQTDLFIFSGVIRNFFLKKREMRDIDMVLRDQIDIKPFFENGRIRKNSFGGFKIITRNVKVDLWYLENTWAIKHQRPINFELHDYIPYTAFFNFSAIAYSFNERRFIYTKDFLRFLRDKKIDFVYKPNFNNTLCIVNSIYYSERFNLKISDRLKRYIIELHKSGFRDYESAQKKHFGNVLYSNQDILEKIFLINRTLKRKKAEKKIMKGFY